ncbi:hypothetical protein [Mesorhizobium sp. M3A.F.Ca.ET.201.01.1.1]|uniref:hypothetical protein n=2 Tax=Mesorhizobium TaxID=68287 RepID=UPI00159654E4|nr:hypothetical protein [Mesorhizobium sp. M3A.F.Ca.ET.201.01.1.1]
MTINNGRYLFLASGSLCRMAMTAALLCALMPAGGCTSDSGSRQAAVAGVEGPKDTGTYPNLNIPPRAAAKQLTKEETAANLAQLKADQQAQLSKGGRAKPANQTDLNTLAKTHGDDALKQIEGKCDPALDPNCN